MGKHVLEQIPQQFQAPIIPTTPWNDSWLTADEAKASRNA